MIKELIILFLLIFSPQKIFFDDGYSYLTKDDKIIVVYNTKYFIIAQSYECKSRDEDSCYLDAEKNLHLNNVFYIKNVETGEIMEDSIINAFNKVFKRAE